MEFITFCLTGCWSPSSLKSKIGSAIENFCTQQFSASANAVHHHAYQPTSCYSTVLRIQHPAQQLAVKARSKKRKSHCPAPCCFTAGSELYPLVTWYGLRSGKSWKPWPCLVMICDDLLVENGNSHDKHIGDISVFGLSQACGLIHHG